MYGGNGRWERVLEGHDESSYGGETTVGDLLRGLRALSALSSHSCEVTWEDSHGDYLIITGLTSHH